MQSRQSVTPSIGRGPGLFHEQEMEFRSFSNSDLPIPHRRSRFLQFYHRCPFSSSSSWDHGGFCHQKIRRLELVDVLVVVLVSSTCSETAPFSHLLLLVLSVRPLAIETKYDGPLWTASTRSSVIVFLFCGFGF